MKRYLRKGVVAVVVMVGLVAAAQPALAWVRVGVNVRVPFPVVVTPVAAVVGAPVFHPRPRVVYYQPVWIPGHFNRWGAWVPGHWR